MTRRVVCLWAMVTIIATGCAGDKEPAGDSRPANSRYGFLQQKDAWKVQGAQATPTPASPGGSASPMAASEVVTDDQGNPLTGQFAILCHTFEGRGHEAMARRAKEILIQKNLNQAHILHRDSASLLYYGYYATHARAQADLHKITTLTDRGQRLFPNAKVVNLDPADPPAPPEWDLRNAKGYFTLVIAAYRDHPDRKQYAVDAVREARAQGLDAYYYHGPTTSSVCIGAWPRTALVEQETDRAATSGLDWQKPIVVSNMPMSGLVARDKVTGGEVKVYAPKIEIVDPTLRQTMQRFDVLWVNDSVPVYVNPQTGQRTPARSFLCVVPGADGSGDDTAATPASPRPSAQQPPYSPLPPSVLDGRPSRPQGGRLRSVGDR